MKCKNCGRTDVYVDDVDGLCYDCYDFVAGYSSYNPSDANPALEAVQQVIWENEDDGYEEQEDYDAE